MPRSGCRPRPAQQRKVPSPKGTPAAARRQPAPVASADRGMGGRRVEVAARIGAVSALGENDPLVSLSDDRVTLRPWHRDDAQFMATASADPEIRRYNGVHDRQGRPAPALSIEEAERAIDRFTTSRQAFEATGNPAGVVFAIADATSGELVGCCGVDDWTEEDVAQFGYWVAAPARGQGVRDPGGHSPDPVAVRARSGPGLLDGRRGESRFGGGSAAGRIRARGNHARLRHLAGPAL